MSTENLYTTDCIRTFTGLYINVFEPTSEMICIEDIAHALSQMPRFGGHLPDFYSVAQHSVHCCYMVPFEYRLQALLHDASEAYLMDMPRPIKKRLTQYKEIEDNLMQVIAQKFGFCYPLEKPVKEADERLLIGEWEGLMIRNQPDFFLRWEPEQAENEFLKAFRQIERPNKIPLGDWLQLLYPPSLPS